MNTYSDPLGGGAGNYGLEFSHALPVVVERLIKGRSDFLLDANESHLIGLSVFVRFGSFLGVRINYQHPPPAEGAQRYLSFKKMHPPMTLPEAYV